MLTPHCCSEHQRRKRWYHYWSQVSSLVAASIFHPVPNSWASKEAIVSQYPSDQHLLITDWTLTGLLSSVDQLDQNLKDIESGPLADEVVQALDAAWKISKADQPNYFHLDLKYTYDTRKALFGV